MAHKVLSPPPRRDRGIPVDKLKDFDLLYFLEMLYLSSLFCTYQTQHYRC
jgi:hypothetical protein